MSLSDDLIS